MVAYPLAPRRAKNKSRRKLHSCSPAQRAAPRGDARPWHGGKMHIFLHGRAAPPRRGPVAPKITCRKNDASFHPFPFLSAYHKKGGASREILDRAGAAQTGGLTTRLRAPAGTYRGGVKTPPYKPPQTAYRIADVPAGRRGGMYAARKAFLRQRGFASRQPVFGCTVGRGLDPAAQCFRCPEGSGPWKRPRAACRPPLHPMADPKITHNVPPSTPPPQSPSFFFREIVLY